MSAIEGRPTPSRTAIITSAVVGLLLMVCVLWLVLVPEAAPVALLALAMLLVVQLVAGVRHRRHP